MTGPCSAGLRGARPGPGAQPGCCVLEGAVLGPWAPATRGTAPRPAAGGVGGGPLSILTLSTLGPSPFRCQPPSPPRSGCFLGGSRPMLCEGAEGTLLPPCVNSRREAVKEGWSLRVAHRPEGSTSGLPPPRAFPHTSQGTRRPRRGMACSPFLLTLPWGTAPPTPRWLFRSKAVPPT